MAQMLENEKNIRSAGNVENELVVEPTESQKQRVSIGLSQNGHLSRHLSRVMKLIEQREQVVRTSPDTLLNKTDLTVKDGNSQQNDSTPVHEVHVNCSIMSLSYDPAAPIEDQIAADLENGLGQLRIAQNIHTKMRMSIRDRAAETEAENQDLLLATTRRLTQGSEAQQDSPTKVLTEDDSGVNLAGTSPFQCQVLTPQIHEYQQHPLGFFKGGQQKQNLISSANDLMLQGKVKPKVQRLNFPKRNSRQNIVKRIKSRENSCQTTPTAAQQQCGNEDVDSKAELASTQQVSTSRGPPVLNLEPSSLQAPIKVTMGRSSKSSQQQAPQQARHTAPTSQQQERKFKMSVLKKDQAKAGQFLTSPSPEPSEILSDKQKKQGKDRETENEKSKKSSLNNQTATAFNSCNSHTYNQKMHTAIRMSQRTNKQKNQRKIMVEADRKKQVFSYNFDSDEDFKRSNAFSPPCGTRNSKQFMSDPNKSRDAASRKLDSRCQLPQYIAGAFEDHDNLKSFFDKEMNRSQMRQVQMNKTQTFFPSTSRKDRPVKEPSTQIEQVLLYKQHEHQQYQTKTAIGQQRRPRQYRNDQPTIRQTTPVHEPQVTSKVAVPRSKRVSSLYQNNVQDPLASDSVAGHSKDIDKGSRSMMIEQSWGDEQLYHPLSVSVQNIRGGLKSPQVSDSKQADELLDEITISKMLLDQQQQQQFQHQKSLFSSMTEGTRLPSKLAASNLSLNRPKNLRNNSLCTPGSIEQAKSSIEKRLINQIDRDLDKTELSVYKKHGQAGQIIFNDRDFELFNLVEHPEWCELTTEMHQVYLSTLQDFNQQLIGQNYFVRKEVTSHETSQTKASKCQPAPNWTPKTVFLSKCLQRINNLFSQHTFLLSQSKVQLTDLVADNKRLQEEVSVLRKEKLIVKDAQHVVNELVNQFFAMGNDRDMKAGRLAEAEKFLHDETITQMLEKEGRSEKTQELDYSNTMSRLEEILQFMTLPNVINKGVQFQMSQYRFDPRFTEKIKGLFESRIATAQNDAAYRTLETVFKDIQTSEIGLQTTEKDIDLDLNNEVKFFRQEAARLQAEMNQNRMRMLQNEKNAKSASKAQTDAAISTAVLSDQLREARRETENMKLQVAKYKELQARAAAEKEQFFTSVSKIQMKLDRVQKFADQCDSLFEKMFAIDNLKEILIAEQEKLLSKVTADASKDIVKKYTQIKNFYVKFEVKNIELKKIIAEYRKQQFEQKKSSAPVPIKKATKKPSLAMELSDEPVKKMSSNNKDVTKAKPRLTSAKRNVVKQTPTQTKKKEAGGSLPPPQPKPLAGGASLPPPQPKPLPSKQPSSFSVSQQSQQELFVEPSGEVDAVPSKKSQDHLVVAKKGKKGASNPAATTSATAPIKPKPATKTVVHVDGLKEDEEEVEGDYSARHKSSIIIENVDQEIINPEPSTVKDDTFENCFNDDTISKKYTDSARASITISVNEMNNSALGNFVDTKVVIDDKKKQPESFRNQQNLIADSGRASTILDGQDPQISSVRSSDWKETMPPITSNITENIIIQRSFGDSNKSKPTNHVNTSSKSVQTDTEQFFKYIFDFLGELERRIDSGELKVEDIMTHGVIPRRTRAVVGVNNTCEIPTESEANSTMLEEALSEAALLSIPSDFQQSNEDRRRITFSIEELRECLRRLKGLSAYGGDVFFSGIARTMIAKPFIPQSLRMEQSVVVPRKASLTQQDSPPKALIDSQKKILQQMTRTKTTVAGGGGPVRDSPPSKAYRAATNSISPFKTNPFNSTSLSPEFKLRTKNTQDDMC